MLHVVRRGSRAGIALFSALIVFSTVLVAPAHAATSSSVLRPTAVSSGDKAVWELHLTVFSEEVYEDVRMGLEASAGTFDLKTMKTLNPGLKCGSSASEGGDAIECDLGDLNDVELTIKAVIDTDQVGDTTIFLDGVISDGGELFEGFEDALSVGSESTNTTHTSGYVPPGGSLSVGPGPKAVSAEDPINGVVKLPKKITPPVAIAANARPVPGPGATLALTVEDPSGFPGACGGQNCDGRILNITNPDTSCGGPCPVLDGYTDPKKPALVTVDWFGPTYEISGVESSVLYVIKAGVGTPAPKCIKSHGNYTNTPCVTKHKLKKTGGQIAKITDVIALLEGDPGVARRK